MSVLPLTRPEDTFVPGSDSVVFVCSLDDCQMAVLAHPKDSPKCWADGEPMDAVES